MDEYTQRLILTDRTMLELKGVLKVENFDNNRIHLVTNLGEMLIGGENLDICHLEGEEIAITGEIALMEYKNLKPAAKAGKNLLSRILK